MAGVVRLEIALGGLKCNVCSADRCQDKQAGITPGAHEKLLAHIEAIRVGPDPETHFL